MMKEKKAGRVLLSFLLTLAKKLNAKHRYVLCGN